MSYVVLARRYRPQTLNDVVGQEHISRTLTNAIAENRVAHAYLFSGPRGVGKTTTARILAKALNCKNGPTATPCGTCVNCQEITSGASVDVQEIDGASNRGIDEIRALRENVKFAPASSKYKIYIIDEAHQITDAAFNALLKTLEEPPEHVVFILATTESHKIPITILSRCQRYRFRLLSSKEIMGHLEKLVKNEGFHIETAALQIITNASGGSMRDALSLLDQAISFTAGDVTSQDLQSLLGFLPKEIISSVTRALAGGDGAKILSTIKEVNEQGFNLLQFGRDLRDHLRHILLFKVNPDVLEITAEDKKVLESEQNLFSVPWLIRAGHLISKALDEMRWSDQPRLVLELYALKLAQPYAPVTELIDRLEKMEKNMPFEPEAAQASLPQVGESARPAAVSRPVTYAAPQSPAAPVSRVQEPAPAAMPTPAVPAVPAPAPTPAADEPAVAGSADIGTAWKMMVREIQQARPIIGSMLTNIRPGTVSGETISVAVSNMFELEGMKRNQQMVEDALAKHFGRHLGLKMFIEERTADPEPAADTAAGPEEIVVPEETPPMPQEFFQVEGELGGGGAIPPGLEKIVGKFPGSKVTKKK